MSGGVVARDAYSLLSYRRDRSLEVRRVDLLFVDSKALNSLLTPERGCGLMLGST